MPEYLSPGVYIEEVNTGPRPIEGVGTACAAFVGFAPAGPTNRPVLVTNWTQYVETFGRVEEGGARNPHMPNTFLSHSVFGYFLNGGGRCYVTRIGLNGAEEKTTAAAAEPLQLPSKSSKAIPSLTIKPKDAAKDDIQVEVAPPTGDGQPDGSFTLKIKMGTTEEVFENITIGAKKGAKNAVETATQTSKLVAVVEEQGTGTAVERMPDVGSYLIKAALPASALQALKSGDFTGDVTQRSGVEGLEVAEDVTMVICPDLMSAYQSKALDRDGVKAVQLSMIAHCERMQDRMAILDPIPDLTPQEVKVWREKTTNYDSKFAALYYPWIKVAGPDGRPLSIPPSGHMAGIYARNDNERGVHKAPANEVLRGVLDVDTQITKGEQDTLNPIGVNCLRNFTGAGLRVWGARTLSSDPAWRYINVRRLFNYVEKSIEGGTQWIVFEPNDEGLWARVRRDITAFLMGVWRDGALFGSTPDQAFFVKCDAELNPPDVRDRGQLVIDIGLAPVKPAEFVIFRFSQFSGGGA
ncbi:MAG: phage tail sheath subtilisin-like domain-containing protein [Thermomicrobia bacterium]|nr:phage tail sheath subtilisin-like domain-containing protein [Thermomicrobia bacterium]